MEMLFGIGLVLAGLVVFVATRTKPRRRKARANPQEQLMRQAARRAAPYGEVLLWCVLIIVACIALIWFFQLWWALVPIPIAGLVGYLAVEKMAKKAFPQARVQAPTSTTPPISKADLLMGLGIMHEIDHPNRPQPQRRPNRHHTRGGIGDWTQS
jgi:TRAP-type C4-dicarboxylate transport system permease large subunit